MSLVDIYNKAKLGDELNSRKFVQLLALLHYLLELPPWHADLGIGSGVMLYFSRGQPWMIKLPFIDIIYS